MNHHHAERGAAALPAALAVIAVSAALTAALAELAGTEVVLARHRQSAATALAAADACLASVMAGLPVGWDFASILTGPDGRTGTPDDGALSPVPGCSATATAAPGPPLPARVRVVVDARVGGGRRRLEAVVGRAVDPAVQALLWLIDPAALGALSGSLTLDVGGERPGAWASVAAPGVPTVLDEWLAAQGPHVTTGPGTGTPLGLPAPPLTELAARVQAAAHGGAETLVEAGTPSPSLAFVAGDLIVDGARRGAGLLYVDGVLDVRGDMEFAGVLVVTGGLHLGTGASLTLAGSLWMGQPEPGQAAIEGEGALNVREDRAAVGSADGLLALPRRARLLGLRDLG